MSRVAATLPPAEHDLLCEGCGYTLNGLPDYSNCPECGEPIAESTGVGRREPPAWETAPRPSIGAFLATSAHVLFRPTHFYRTLATRRDIRRAASFATIHWIFDAILFGIAAAVHTVWYQSVGGSYFGVNHWTIPLVIFTLLAYWSLVATTALAARLTR